MGAQEFVLLALILCANPASYDESCNGGMRPSLETVS